MDCPNCHAEMADVTESWHTFAASEGAEYLSSYVTIWHCPSCQTVAGAQGPDLEWVLQPQEASAED